MYMKISILSLIAVAVMLSSCGGTKETDEASNTESKKRRGL